MAPGIYDIVDSNTVSVFASYDSVAARHAQWASL
jgi:hypothetical protein